MGERRSRSRRGGVWGPWWHPILDFLEVDRCFRRLNFFAAEASLGIAPLAEYRRIASLPFFAATLSLATDRLVPFAVHIRVHISRLSSLSFLRHRLVPQNFIGIFIRKKMVKFAAAFLSLFLASASANTVVHEMKDIKADSALGMRLLSEARQLNDNQMFDNTWVAGYSLKFEGCRTFFSSLVLESAVDLTLGCSFLTNVLASSLRSQQKQTTSLSGTTKPMARRMYASPRNASSASVCAPAITAIPTAAAPAGTVTTSST